MGAVLFVPPVPLCLLLLPTLVSSELLCHDRQELSESTEFRDSVFLGCTTAPVHGGAFFLSNPSLTLKIVRCRFLRCSSAQQSGGIFCYPCKSFSISYSCGHECTAGSFGTFFEAGIASPALGSIEVNATSAFLCRGRFNTFEVVCDSFERGSTSVVERVNASHNHASGWGSGLLLLKHFFASLRFCALTTNTGGNCLYISSLVINSAVTNLDFFNNSCKTEGRFLGLVHLLSTVTIGASVFQANSVDCFLSGVAGIKGTFAGCVFDTAQFSTTGAVGMATTGCRITGRRTLPGSLRLCTCPTSQSADAAIALFSWMWLHRRLSVVLFATLVVLLVDENYGRKQPSDYELLDGESSTVPSGESSSDSASR
jgi:hypothetical protein